MLKEITKMRPLGRRQNAKAFMFTEQCKPLAITYLFSSGGELVQGCLKG